MAAVVNGLEPRYELLHARAETVERRRHAREYGVAADCRHYLCAQHRRHRRLGTERFIRMPDVRGERRIVFVISKFDEDRCLLVVWGEGMNG